MSAPKEDPRAMAARIARDLFTNGAGQRAKRLVLELSDGRNGGGWSECAAADRILDTLLAAPSAEPGEPKP